MTKLIHLLIAVSILVAFQVTAAAAPQPNCMTVNMASSAASNTSVTATTSVANCFPAGAQLLGISLTVSSSNDAVASPTSNQIPVQAANSPVVAQINIHNVTVCTSVTITFSMLSAGTTTTVTKTLMVCPFHFDIGVSGVSVTPSPAGQPSQVDVTIFNQGKETLFTNSYNVDLSTQEDTAGLVRDSCSNIPGQIVQAPTLPDILPGEQRTVSLNFRFPQAGNFTLKAHASIGGSEDGPSSNNTRSQIVSVPLPPPLICAVTNADGLVTFDGNWFIPFGSSTVPTVRFGNSPAESVEVVSPRLIRARISRSACFDGSVQASVANTTGSTNGGSVSPNPPRITGLTRQGSRLRIRLTNFRPSCYFEVSLAIPGQGRTSAQVVLRSPQLIVINLPRILGALIRVTVSTRYGMTTRAIFINTPFATSLFRQ